MDLRAEIDRALADGRPADAARDIARLWRSAKSSATAAFLDPRIDRVIERASLPKQRLFVLRSFTIEPLVPLLRAEAAAAGVWLEVRLGGFGTYAQELLDPASDLYSANPDVVLVAVQTRDLAPSLWSGFGGLTGAEVVALVARTREDLAAWIATLRARSNARILIHALESPRDRAFGAADDSLELGQAEAVRQINRELAAIAACTPGVHLLDWDGLVARLGRDAFYDEAKWFSARQPIAAAGLVQVAAFWVRALAPLLGRAAKVVVTDLDNTLWGGVAGEDGPANLELGVEYPGAAYRAVQQALLDLRARGILLAVASKNNEPDLGELLDGHPEMLLRREHFAALRINWNDKACSVREIAAELGVGLDAMVFLDDSPAERDFVAEQLPEVTVIDLPADPFGFARALRDCPRLDRLTLSAEDRERPAMYTADRARAELHTSAGDLDAFYRSLEMSAEIRSLDPARVARVSQLTEKTNQFNLTTRRYGEAELAALMDDPSWRVLWLRARDRFGDHGIVGAVIVRCDAGRWQIDTFLLSCRVIGRTLETALLAEVAAQARAAGASVLEGWFRVTAKNAPAADFYPRHGFVEADRSGSSTLWRLDLASATVAAPPWVQRSDR